MNRAGKALCALSTGVLVAIATAAPSSAQTWPQRSVRFIVSLGPGSGADLSARLIADRLTTTWKQPVVVENRPGGDAVVAITAFIGTKDDHVLLYTPTSSFTAHPYQHAKLPYDPRELHPVARVSNTIVVFAVPALSKVKSVAEFIAQVKSADGTLNYTTATGMTDFIYDGYFKTSGLGITRVPYKDTVQALTDLGEGRIQAYIGALAIVRPHIAAGRVRLIAVTNSERASTLPDVPTIAEAGFPELTFDGLVGLFGPGTLTEESRARIATDIGDVLKDPAVSSKLVATGQALSPGTGQDFAASLEKQRATLAAIAKRLGLKAAQ